MMLAGNVLMTKMGFAISFGIIIAAFVMALFFTPSVTALISRAAWWPGTADPRRATVPRPRPTPSQESMRAGLTPASPSKTGADGARAPRVATEGGR